VFDERVQECVSSFVAIGHHVYPEISGVVRGYAFGEKVDKRFFDGSDDFEADGMGQFEF